MEERLALKIIEGNVNVCVGQELAKVFEKSACRRFGSGIPPHPGPLPRWGKGRSVGGCGFIEFVDMIWKCLVNCAPRARTPCHFNAEFVRERACCENAHWIIRRKIAPTRNDFLGLDWNRSTDNSDLRTDTLRVRRFAFEPHCHTRR